MIYNSKIINKKQVIESSFKQEDLISLYLPDYFKNNKSVKFYESKGKIICKDFNGTFSGNIYSLAAYHYDINKSGFLSKEEFKMTLDKMYDELILNKDSVDIQSTNIYVKDMDNCESTIIKPFISKYTNKFKEWLSTYKLEFEKDKELLETLGIKQSYKVIINDYVYYRIATNDICICYLDDDNDDLYKIYRPLVKNKNYKWRTNLPFDSIDDYGLNRENNNFILTKSRKDRAILKKLGIESYAFSSEIYVPDTLPYNTKYILYDNDETGIKQAKIFVEKFNLIPIEIPKINKIKDISDLAKEKSLQDCYDLIKNYMTNNLDN